jgi:hypothetical protein
MNLLDNSNDQIELDPNKKYYDELVGEAKKFKDNEALARGKFEADIHIQTLQRRLDEMREDYKKVYEESKTAPKLQDLLNKIEQMQTPASRETPPSNEDNRPAAIDPEQIESLISNKLMQHEQTRKQTENLNLVQTKVKERFGDNFKSALKQQADALGLTDDDVNNMAKNNPNLFFKTFDVNTPRGNELFQTPPQSERNGFTPKGNQKRTLSYYENLRKQDPMLYYDPKIAVQMDKDAQALGNEFFDV